MLNITILINSFFNRTVFQLYWRR